MRLLQATLAGLYFLFAAYLGFQVIDGLVMSMQPNTYVELFPFAYALALLAAMWFGFGVLELQGYHRQSITGSVVSMLFLALPFLVQDGHYDLIGLLTLAFLASLPVTSLIDLRTLSGSRDFGYVLSVDSLLLILISLSNYQSNPGSNTIRGSPELEGIVSFTAGSLMLAYGIFRTIRPGRGPGSGIGPSFQVGKTP